MGRKRRRRARRWTPVSAAQSRELAAQPGHRAVDPQVPKHLRQRRAAQLQYFDGSEGSPRAVLDLPGPDPTPPAARADSGNQCSRPAFADAVHFARSQSISAHPRLSSLAVGATNSRHSRMPARASDAPTRLERRPDLGMRQGLKVRPAPFATARCLIARTRRRTRDAVEPLLIPSIPQARLPPWGGYVRGSSLRATGSCLVIVPSSGSTWVLSSALVTGLSGARGCRPAQPTGG